MIRSENSTQLLCQVRYTRIEVPSASESKLLSLNKKHPNKLFLSIVNKKSLAISSILKFTNNDEFKFAGTGVLNDKFLVFTSKYNEKRDMHSIFYAPFSQPNQKIKLRQVSNTDINKLVIYSD
jgi:hypothetical protein